MHQPSKSTICSVAACVQGLAAHSQPVDAILGLPDAASIPKHYRQSTTVAVDIRRSASDIEQFLLAELAESLKVDASVLRTDIGLDDIGVTSLLSLRLSQRLRRFVGREFSAFVLSRNPTIVSLAEALTSADAPGAVVAAGAKVLCLHGYRTSSTVLRQQMLPLTEILDSLGYTLVVPDGTYVTAGAAQFAEGLDEEDAYGWWEYQSEDAGDDSAPIGLEKSIDRLVTGIAGSISHGRVCHHVLIFI